MDGVPMVTQCSIHEGDTFRYDFIANNEGTHFWHSHDGKYTYVTEARGTSYEKHCVL
jgi:FtsP/CotA-like multicopper oxidase with cupredoxin domain